MKEFVLLNFAYGYGPFLRTSELAFEVNKKLEAKGRATLGIIVPLVYGERQKKIMEQEFGKERMEKIFFDETLGKILESVFYGKKNYEESLRMLVEKRSNLEKQAREYLASGIRAKSFSGEDMIIPRDAVRMCLARSPRLDFGIRPSYNSSFASVSEILKRASENQNIAFDKALLSRAASEIQEIEKAQQLNLIAEPGTFDSEHTLKENQTRAIPTPPTLLIPPAYHKPLEQGIYVTITGIPGLERLFTQAEKLNLKIYTNNPEAVSRSIYASPEILSSPSILLHFARSGWGSAWLSQFTGTLFVTPPYDKADDPEIYFNNLTLEKTGLGIIYKNQSLDELLEKTKNFQYAVEAANGRLLHKFGTLNGLDYTAKIIADDFTSL